MTAPSGTATTTAGCESEVWTTSESARASAVRARSKVAEARARRLGSNRWVGRLAGGAGGGGAVGEEVGSRRGGGAEVGAEGVGDGAFDGFGQGVGAVGFGLQQRFEARVLVEKEGEDGHGQQHGGGGHGGQDGDLPGQRAGPGDGRTRLGNGVARGSVQVPRRLISMDASERPRLVVLDAMSLIHRAYHAVPRHFATSTGEPTNAVFGFTNILLADR